MKKFFIAVLERDNQPVCFIRRDGIKSDNSRFCIFTKADESKDFVIPYSPLFTKPFEKIIIYQVNTQKGFYFNIEKAEHFTIPFDCRSRIATESELEEIQQDEFFNLSLITQLGENGHQSFEINLAYGLIHKSEIGVKVNEEELCSKIEEHF